MSTTRIGDICSYRNETVSASVADQDSYVSTESMLPNRGGVRKATSFPSDGSVKRFRQGDTLVSNIRPYFKKIWRATKNGTCSNDVLVFEPTNCDSEFLYWALSNEEFFDYAVATSKGTKMPRGDKSAIMDYSITPFTIEMQRSISRLLRPIQEKTNLNNRINDYLAA